MPRAWTGANPVNVVDSSAYEMGTEQRANQDITLTKVWIWGDTASVVGRQARIWNPATASVIATVSLPDTLPAGWSSYDLPIPLTRSVGQRWLVSYHTGGNYGVVARSLNADVNSADGAVTTLATGNATNGNGVFRTTPGLFPNQTFEASFYGVDMEYVLGSGSDTPPIITAVTVDTDHLGVVVSITATDQEGLTGATYGVEWGDGQVGSGPGSSFSHTYADAGTYPILVRVTDVTGLSDFAAAVAIVSSPVPVVGDPLVMPLAEQMLACYETELLKLADPPKSVGVRPGTIVDFLMSMSDDECCNGLAWVRPVTFYPSSTAFPTQDTTAQKQGTRAWAVTLELGYVRCAPTPDADAIPSNAEWFAVTQAVMDAAAAMRRAICCWSDSAPMRVQRILPGQWEPVAVEGGCVGGTIPITLMGLACDCSADTSS